MEFQRWTRLSAAALILGLTATACDDATGPVGDFDAEEAAQAMESMVSAVETQELSDAFGSLAAADSLLSGGTAALLADSPVRTDAARLRTLASMDPAADVLPPALLGTTFEWSEAENRYVASDATDAPAEVIRVIYYAIDPTTHRPASPLNALGYVDLRDLSTDSSNRLGVTVVRTSGESPVTLADYYLDLSFTLTQSSLTIDVAAVGYLSNGADQLNFDLAHGLTAADSAVSVTQAYDLDLEGTENAISFAATVTLDPQSQSDTPQAMEAEATITDGTQTVHMVISWADQVLDGTIFHNSDPVVLISGTLDEPSFADGNGDPLTEEQLAALQDLWDAIGEMFDFVENLFGWAT